MKKIRVRRTRRRGYSAVAVAAITLGGLAACSTSATTSPAAGSQQSAVSVTLAESVENITDLPIWVAQQQGYFAAHGLNVKTVVLTTASVTPALISGSAQFIKDPGFVYVTSRIKGADIQAISKMDTGIPFALIVGKSYAAAHQITTSTPVGQVLQRLAGSVGGSTAAGQVGATKVLLDSYGVKLSYRGATFATVPAMVAALAQGQIDWFVAAQPIPAQAAVAGDGIVVATYKNAKAWSAQPADFVLAASTAYVKANPTVAKEMVAAIDEGLRYVALHEQQSVAIATSHEHGLTSSEISAAIEALQWPTSGSMNNDFWNSSLGYFETAGIIPKGTSASILNWTNAYVASGG